MARKISSKVDKIVDELVKKGVTRKDVNEWYNKTKLKEALDKGDIWIDKKLIEMNLKRR